ncbi:hypothetical protein D3C80_2097530 [compost metagenome]
MGTALQTLYSDYAKYKEATDPGTVNTGSPGTLPSSAGSVISNVSATPTPAAFQTTQDLATPSSGSSTSDDSAFWNDIWK